MSTEPPMPAGLERLLNQLPTDPAPVNALLMAGRAARRRRHHRLAISGAIAATASIIGGAVTLTSSWGDHNVTPTSPPSTTSHHQNADVRLASGQVVPADERGAARDQLGPDAAGRTVDLTELRHRVVFIATVRPDCASCQTEIASLNQLQANASQGDFALIGIDVREDAQDQPISSPAGRNLGFPVLDDSTGSILEALLASADDVPSITALDRQGRVAAQLVGPATLSSMTELFQELASEPDPSSPSGHNRCDGTSAVLAQGGVTVAVFPSGGTATFSAGKPIEWSKGGPCADDITFAVDGEPSSSSKTVELTLSPGMHTVEVAIAMCASVQDPSCRGGLTVVTSQLEVEPG